MYIILSPVESFTPDKQTSTPSSQLFTSDITSLKHLSNKITPHTNPVVTIDHGQTAQLALLNGIRSTPTLPTPMPAGFKKDLPAEAGGGNYGNDGDYDARKWGYADANATLSPADFHYLTSKLTQKARNPWGDSAVIHGAAVKSLVEKCMEEKYALDERKRQEYLACLKTCKVVTVCACDIPECTICGDCTITELISELTVMECPLPAEAIEEADECDPCPSNKITLKPTGE